MKIFIPHIPSGLKRQELLTIIQGVVKPAWFAPFTKGGTVAKCNLIRILDMDTGRVEFHGVVDVYPQKAAEKVVKSLEGKVYNGHKLTARMWVDRTLIIGGKKNLPNGQQNCKRRRNLEISTA